MFSRYFREQQEKLMQFYAPAGKTASARKNDLRKRDPVFEEFRAVLEGMLPKNLSLGRVAIRDRSGYTPDMADYTAFRAVSRDTAAVFSSIIPSEIACASYFLSAALDRKTLFESLIRVAHVKKCDRYDGHEGEPGFIASFVVSFGSGYSLAEIKQSIVEMYSSQDVDPEFEADIVAVLGQGLIIKKWGETRSYAAIETAEDTLTWFYILMNEYLDTDKGSAADLRSFVLDGKNYPEY
ncbi:MAG: hypothetical protein ACRCUT_08725 [Spirochaetota bacterium]